MLQPRKPQVQYTLALPEELTHDFAFPFSPASTTTKFRPASKRGNLCTSTTLAFHPLLTRQVAKSARLAVRCIRTGKCGGNACFLAGPRGYFPESKQGKVHAPCAQSTVRHQGVMCVRPDALCEGERGLPACMMFLEVDALILDVATYVRGAVYVLCTASTSVHCHRGWSWDGILFLRLACGARNFGPHVRIFGFSCRPS